MKAIVYTRYGSPDILELHEKEKPSPKDNEVLVRVHASSVNAMEWRPFTFPRFLMPLLGGGFRTPKITTFGGDLAGTVEAVGAAVTQFRPGDAVFGTSRGAYAEYVCAPDHKIVPKPPNISFEAAAAVPVAALTALQALRDHGKIRAGQKVLINGAGGGVGTFAVQIAKSFGTEVTGVCGPRSLDVVKSIGADHVIDYTKEDFTKSGQRYDLIIGANGYHSILDYKRALNSGGTYVVLGGAMAQMFQALLLGPFLSFGNKKFRGMMTRPNQKDLLLLKELLETGKIVPAIDRTYPLNQVPDAIKFLMQGHARGKVVITVAS